ncbi:hypothetical protein Scep_019154 [Stephania cephalantha]|uniref:Histone deacetylase domain-containing protein n=1 Tax=Stephania cephalantha TaxID=152367 RepID=A0AAP0IAE7_9MAGN
MVRLYNRPFQAKKDIAIRRPSFQPKVADSLNFDMMKPDLALLKSCEQDEVGSGEYPRSLRKYGVYLVDVVVMEVETLPCTIPLKQIQGLSNRLPLLKTLIDASSVLFRHRKDLQKKLTWTTIELRNYNVVVQEILHMGPWENMKRRKVIGRTSYISFDSFQVRFPFQINAYFFNRTFLYSSNLIPKPSTPKTPLSINQANNGIGGWKLPAIGPDATKRKVRYFYDPEVGNYYYGQGHPMKPHRIRMTHSLLSHYGLLGHMSVLKPFPARDRDLCRFHVDDYVSFLRSITPETNRTETTQKRKARVGKRLTGCESELQRNLIN